MAKLVDVYRVDKQTCLGRRQLPLVVDENLTMVMDLDDTWLPCDSPPIRGKALEQFMCKFNVLTEVEICDAMRVSCKDLLEILGQTVPCVGCRRSVEHLFYQLVESGHPALDPIIVTRDGSLEVRQDHMLSSQKLGTLLHGNSAKLDSLIDGLPRSRKSRRCGLHSLDSQRSRPPGQTGWLEIWELMHGECQNEIALVDALTLLQTLENYLRKHRFCGECRAKVLRAYTLLVDGGDGSREKGYQPSLYSGIRRCSPEKHLHLQTNTEFIASLVCRAEPELVGSRRERHAKTLEVAQEEVLTCVGLCICERLHRVQQRMREQERTAQLLSALALEALGRSFEVAVETKRGVTQMELLYEEIRREERVKQQRRELKKQKRRRKKKRAEEEKDGCHCGQDESAVNDDELSDGQADSCSDDKPGKLPEKDVESSSCSCSASGKGSVAHHRSAVSSSSTTTTTGGGGGEGSLWSSQCSSELSRDAGYSSENNPSSPPSSPDGSEVACSEGFCNHEGECTLDCAGDCRLCDVGNGDASLTSSTNVGKSHHLKLSLEQMLDAQASCSSDDEGSFISAEEVREFRSRLRHVTQERQQLRQTLRQRFHQLCTNSRLTQPSK